MSKEDVTIADFIQMFACYQCVYGKEPCEYLPEDESELCTHYKWKDEQLLNEIKEQEHVNADKS